MQRICDQILLDFCISFDPLTRRPNTMAGTASFAFCWCHILRTLDSLRYIKDLNRAARKEKIMKQNF